MQTVLKKVGIFIIVLMASMSAYAWNPFFGEHEHQIAFNLGQGFNRGWLVAPPVAPVPYYTANFQYSQPATFFKLPARQSLNVSMNVGLGEKYDWDWRDFTIPIGFWSGDVSPVYGENWYTGVGVGMGFQAQENARIDSKLIFQFKLLGGYKINENLEVELFMQHFSNGSVSTNRSYLFWGLGIIHSF